MYLVDKDMLADMEQLVQGDRHILIRLDLIPDYKRDSMTRKLCPMDDIPLDLKQRVMRLSTSIYSMFIIHSHTHTRAKIIKQTFSSLRRYCTVHNFLSTDSNVCVAYCM